MNRFCGICALFTALLALCLSPARADDQWVVYPGSGDGPGKGKHIVFVTGDNEYRSEESMPQLAKILATRHGFTCTVLFAIDKSGTIDPDTENNIPGLEALDHADLMVLFTRFRNLPPDQMKHIMDYVNAGKPVVALRTATHAFNFDNKDNPYYKWTWNYPNGETKGGFGRAVLGETWISHYGNHMQESSRGIIAKDMQDHPILRGVHDVWAPDDVYGVTTLSGDSKPLIMGQPLSGMDPKDKPNEKKPAIPIAWVKTYMGSEGKASRIFTTTLGGSFDFKNEGFRRLLVNACFWALGMEDNITNKLNIDFVGEYNPSQTGFKGFKKGVKPADHKM